MTVRVSGQKDLEEHPDTLRYETSDHVNGENHDFTVWFLSNSPRLTGLHWKDRLRNRGS